MSFLVLRSQIPLTVLTYGVKHYTSVTFGPDPLKFVVEVFLILADDPDSYISLSVEPLKEPELEVT